MSRTKILKLFILVCILFIPQISLYSQIIPVKSITDDDEDYLFQSEAEEVGFIEFAQFDDNGGYSEAIAIKDGIAYVANREEGLEIVNITQPDKPEKIANIETLGYATEVLVEGDFAYVSQSIQGVAIINIENPRAPYVVHNLKPGGQVKNVAIRNTLLYIITSYSGFYLYDIVNPNNPLFVSHFDSNKLHTDVKVSTKFVCLATWGYGLEILDLTFHSNPVLIGFWNESTGIPLGIDVMIDENQKIAYLASNNAGLEIINFTIPQSPHIIGSFDTFDSIYDVVVANNIAYLCSYNYGIISVNVTDPTNPIELDNLATSGQAVDGAIENSTYAIADRFGGIKTYDVEDPSNIVQLGQFFDHGSAFKVVIDGDIAIIADRLGGFEFINISDPSNPKKVGHYIEHGRSVLEVDIAGDIAILSLFDNGIEFVNISDITNPTHIASYENGRNIRCTAVKDDLVFVGAMNKTLEVLNISQLPFILMIEQYDFPMEHPNVEELVVRNDTLLVGYSQGYKLINITDPTNIFDIDTYEDGNYVNDIKLENDILYCARGSLGLEIMNISDNQFQRISGLNTNGMSRDIIVDNNTVYIADQTNGIEVANITNINNPVDIGGYTQRSIYGIAKYGQYVISCAWTDGVLVLALDSDSDTITDIDEIDIWGTDPFNDDTDFDEMPDDFEIIYGLNPLNSSDATDDPDQDGLTNLYEWAQVLFYGESTDPFNPDTDFDNMPDGWEVDNRLNPLVQNGDLDLDFDSLTNYEEFIYGTDPRNSDTDDDDANDGLEILFNTDPLNPKDNPIRRRLIRFFLAVPLAVIFLIFVITYSIRVFRKRIARNIEREKRLEEAEDEVLLF
ncbi:MAG: hypothetical protein FK733_01620 [Asgard group archaeon]|nr:hypothetical protein [Asgard group archaeon]